MEEKTNDTINAIIIITSIFVLVGGFVIVYILYFNKRKAALIIEKEGLQQAFSQQLHQSRIEVQEQTYQHIGKELHDNVSQLLSSSKMLLGVTERSLEHPPTTLLSANDALSQAIREIRSLAKSLDKEWLERFSFVDNLQEEIARVNSGQKITSSLKYSEELDLGSDQQIMLFRIVQEAIQNAIKHAHPKNISIGITKVASLHHIIIADDGYGISGKSGNGMGLANMKYRTQLLGGQISWDSTPGKGTVVRIALPEKKQLL